ncbi:DNA-3-methyladenine glycosylase I [Ottowia thiooxydans]|uniref:DNA-3-methyladenine glycosylase I n=1 Tax=Ottowia thiooxydans TaxID=219182 RepID=UPI00048AC9B3|nr:DNA-3-methyladenine glycosylase I [Ottowia thiooxydans]
MSTSIPGPDGRLRCHWCAGAQEFFPYHDDDWGFPVKDDRTLFEKLSLEGFQSGLSWRTILTKRENFRAAFKGFDFDLVARFTADDIQNMLGDSGIVRHRGKIEAVIQNARCAREMVDREGSLAAFFWRYEPTALQSTQPQIVSTSAESVQLSKDLKKLGWKFVGPTTMYAFMQAAGIVNDHAQDCVIRAEADKARRAFKTPGNAPRSAVPLKTAR